MQAEKISQLHTTKLKQRTHITTKPDENHSQNPNPQWVSTNPFHLPPSFSFL